MSQQDAEMERFVLAMYDGPSWKKRVAKMSRAQIFAIYTKEQNRLAELAAEARYIRENEDQEVELDDTDIPF